MGCLLEKISNHLFLLVGNNPLPNYIAAHRLTKPESYLHLIYTDETHHYALNLQDLFTRVLHFDKSHISLKRLESPTDQSGIHTCLDQYLISNPLSEGSVGLNYTGGMKPMSVHIYEYIKDWCARDHRQFIYSYIDPVYYSIRFSHGMNYLINFSECQISMENLLGLHNRKIISVKSEVLFPNFCKEVAAFVSNPVNMNNLRNWCDKYVRTTKPKELKNYLKPLLDKDRLDSNCQIKDMTELIEKIKQWVTKGSIGITTEIVSEKDDDLTKHHKIITIGKIGLALLKYDQIPDEEIHNWKINQIGDSLWKFLDSNWLENFVFECLQQIAEDCQIHEITRNIYIKSADPKRQSRDFEFDVAAIQGYRLYAFSCSTSMDRGLVKVKLIEAFSRAKQMGGDEARIALVSGYPQPDDLLDEINESWMASRDKIRIFGPQDFSNLINELKKWFTS
jgi:hypothetical protein